MMLMLYLYTCNSVRLNVVYKLCITESSYNPRPEKTKGVLFKNVQSSQVIHTEIQPT